MRAILVLYLISEQNISNPGLGWTNAEAIQIYGWYTAFVYLALHTRGIVGDKLISTKNAVTLGGFLLCRTFISCIS